MVSLMIDKFVELLLYLSDKYTIPQYEIFNLTHIEDIVRSTIYGDTTKLGMFSPISSIVKNGSSSNLVINFWISVLLLFKVYANTSGLVYSFMLAGSGMIIRFQYI